MKRNKANCYTLCVCARVCSNEAGKQLPVVGSPWWMAPECIHGKRYGERADVFSYGIILCEVIARIESDPDILPRSKVLNHYVFVDDILNCNKFKIEPYFLPLCEY